MHVYIVTKNRFFHFLWKMRDTCIDVIFVRYYYYVLETLLFEYFLQMCVAFRWHVLISISNFLVFTTLSRGLSTIRRERIYLFWTDIYLKNPRYLSLRKCQHKNIIFPKLNLCLSIWILISGIVLSPKFDILLNSEKNISQKLFKTLLNKPMIQKYQTLHI